MTDVEITMAASSDDYVAARVLIEEYAANLGVDLCFQDFPHEIANLHSIYAPPLGALLLARIGGELIGCVGVRRHDADVCEMKRLYVKPQHRKGGLGRCLAESAIRCAEQLDYSRMVLDTLPSMAAAHALYETLGFREIERYYDNPLSGVRYLARELVGRGRDSA